MEKRAEQRSEQATSSQAATQSVPFLIELDELPDRADKGDSGAQTELQREKLKRAKQQIERATSSQPAKQSVPLPTNFKELRDRADQGDLEAQAELKHWLDENPTVWRKLGDLANHAQMVFLRLAARNDFLFSESIRRRAEEMQQELAGCFPTPLELLAVQRVVAAWLQLQHVESQIALADDDLPRAKFWLQRQLQANRLYHAATKSLLLIRELLPPPAPPAALAANGKADTALRRNGRLPESVNGEASRHSEGDVAPVNRINGTARNGRRRELATT